MKETNSVKSDASRPRWSTHNSSKTYLPLPVRPMCYGVTAEFTLICVLGTRHMPTAHNVPAGAPLDPDAPKEKKLPSEVCPRRHGMATNPDICADQLHCEICLKKD